MTVQELDGQIVGNVAVRPHEQDRDLFQLVTALWLPRPVEEVFEFFSDARGLETLTPPWIRFKIVTPTPIEMRPGTVIDYKLRIRGVGIRWRTLIPVWEPPHRFVDEQVRGPYRYWRHEHLFEPSDGGTIVRDHVDYRVPGGRVINRWFVQPDVERIFRFRLAKLKEVFGAEG